MHGRIGFRVSVSGDGQDVVQDLAVALARQVEIAVVAQVHHGGHVRLGLIGDPQAVVRQQGIGDLRLQIAGEARLPVRGGAAQGQGIPLDLGCPQIPVKALGTAMEAVVPAVGGKGYGFAQQREAGAADPVGIAAQGGAQMGAPLQIS